MAKLPDNFVKPPPASSRLNAPRTTAGKVARKSRKAEDGAAAPAPDAAVPEAHHAAAPAGPIGHSVLVRLSADEHQALSAACDALAAIGEPMTLEEMTRQVIGRWIAATHAMQAASVPARSAPPAPRSLPMPMRRFVAEPLRRWQSLGETLRRWSRAFGRR